MAALTPALADEAPVAKPAVSAEAMAKYRALLEAYNTAHDAYVAAVSAYWSSIADRRRLRFAKRAAGQPIALEDYVLTQPPVYWGRPSRSIPRLPRSRRRRCRQRLFRWWPIS